MPEKSLQLYSAEFIKEKSSSKNPEYVFDFLIYEPKNIEEVQLGTLFMLGKIENIPKNKYKNFDFLLNLIISVIKREFYADPQRSSLEALEASLNKANLYLADFAEKGNVEWINNFHFICGAFSKNIIHITQTGNLFIKLLRGTIISHIEKKFPNQKKPHPLNTFGNIASGTIVNGDKIILGTKNILDIISPTNLKELSKNNCNHIIRNLEELTKNKTNNKSPLICLVLEARRLPEKEIIFQSPQTVYKKELLKKKKNRLLKIKPIVLKILSVFRKISIIIFLLICRFISFLIYVLKKIYKLIKPLTPVVQIETRIKTKLAPKIKSALIIFPNAFVFLKSRTKILYKQNKPAFFISILLALLILVLPYFIAQEINYYVKLKNFNRLAAEIQSLEKKIDTALIYQDKNKAKALIQKNQPLLTKLFEYSQKSFLKNNEQAINKLVLLKNKHQNQQDSVNNVIRIESLEPVLDFSKTGFIVNPVGIAKIENNLYFYELDSGILYKFNLKAEEKNPLTLIFISAKDELRKMISLEDNGQIILFGQSEKIYIHNSHTDKHNTYLLNPAISLDNIKDLGNFLSNFYVLDNYQSNIIKYSLSEIKENTINGKNWLPKPIEELKNAQSMTINGSIYILGSDGTIVEYFKGEKVGQIQPQLEKSLKGDNKIFIKPDFKNFYISDPKNKRLIVLNKNGEIINQYINDEFINLHDFWITKNEEEAYLLCGKKVYKFEIF